VGWCWGTAEAKAQMKTIGIQNFIFVGHPTKMCFQSEVLPFEDRLNATVNMLRIRHA